MIGVFAVCTFESGEEIYEIMTMDDINAIKAKSKNSGAWRDFFSEMAKKAVVRRLCKQLNLNFNDKEQADSFSGADEMIDDPKEQAAKDIEEGANKTDFESEVVIEVDPNEIEGQQTMKFDEG